MLGRHAYTLSHIVFISTGPHANISTHVHINHRAPKKALRYFKIKKEDHISISMYIFKGAHSYMLSYTTDSHRYNSYYLIHCAVYKCT